MRLKKAWIGAALVLGIGGGTAAIVRPEWIGLGTEHALRRRVDGYWSARVAGDLKAIAPFIHPLQKTVQEKSILVTEKYEVGAMTVDGNDAQVTIKAKYRLNHPHLSKHERELTHNDPWVRYKGQWYHAVHATGFGETLKQGMGKWKPPTQQSKR